MNAWRRTLRRAARMETFHNKRQDFLSSSFKGAARSPPAQLTWWVQHRDNSYCRVCYTTLSNSIDVSQVRQECFRGEGRFQWVSEHMKTDEATSDSRESSRSHGAQSSWISPPHSWNTGNKHLTNPVCSRRPSTLGVSSQRYTRRQNELKRWSTRGIIILHWTQVYC